MIATGPSCTREPEARASTSVQPQRVTAHAAEASLQAAETYIQSQQYELAETILRTLINRDASNPDAFELLGRVRQHQAVRAETQGRPDMARVLKEQSYEQYRKATELLPDSAILHGSAGMMAITAGMKDAALEHYRIAAARDPSNPQYPLFAAQLLIENRQYRKAREALARVLKIDPDAAFAHASLAVIAMSEGRRDEAIAHIEEARAIDSGNLDLRIQHARLLRQFGRPRDALDVLIHVDGNERAHIGVADEIARSYDLLGLTQRGARALELAARQQPYDGELALRISEMWIRAAAPQRAAAWLDRAALLHDDERAISKVRQLLAEHNKSDRALAHP